MRHIHIVILLWLFGCSTTEDSITFLGPEAQFSESGLEYIMLAEGDGPEAQLGLEMTTNCVLKVGDSTLVWETTEEDPFVFLYSESGMIKGFIEVIGMMNEGDKIKVVIPPDLGYGSFSNDPIPADAYLSYEIDLIKVEDPKLWVADSLFSSFQSGSKEAGLALYDQMKKQPGTYNLSERHLRLLASLLQKDGRVNDKFEVVKLRASEYPDSFGAHMQLAEVYLERGEKSKAIAELQRSLEIDEDNVTALGMLNDLE